MPKASRSTKIFLIQGVCLCEQGRQQKQLCKMPQVQYPKLRKIQLLVLRHYVYPASRSNADDTRPFFPASHQKVVAWM